MTDRNDSFMDVLDECVELLRKGAGINACLERFPEHATTLAPLLATVAQLQELRPVPARAPEMAAQRRAEFMAATRALPPARNDASAGLLLWWHTTIAGLVQIFRPATPRAVPVGLMLLLIGFIAAGLLGTLGVTASADALPGDLLYPVKTTTEDVRLFLTRNPAARDALAESIAAERRQEAAAIAELQRRVDRLRVEGIIEQVGDDAWMISGLNVRIGPDTRIEGTPRPGARVEAVLNAPGDGSLVAVLLRVLPGAEGATNPGLIGDTEAATATSTAEPTATVHPTLTASPSPTLPAPAAFVRPIVAGPEDDRPDRVQATRAPTATVTPRVTATVTPLRTPSPVPTRPPDLPAFRLIDRVIRIEGYRWTIGAITMDTDANTRFIDSPDLGYQVSAVYVVRPDGSALALEIRTLATPVATPAPFAMTGALQSINGDHWTIEGFVVTVNANTTLENEPGIGDMVQVSGRQKADGEIIASRIKALRDVDKHFEGPIEEIAADHWVVGGQYVLLDGNTEIIGEPSLGLTAQVEAVQRNDGSLVARRIYVEEPEPDPTATPTEATPEPTATPTEPPAEPTATPTEPLPEPTATPTEPPPEATPTDTPPAPGAAQVLMS